MKKIIFFISPILFLMACNVSTTPISNGTVSLDSIKVGREIKPEIKYFKGIYRPHFSQFINCEDNRLYILKSNSLIDSVYNSILPNAYTDEAVYMKLSAPLDPNDSSLIDFGIGSSFNIEQKNSKNTCILSDYWCTGMEPFWQIQISEKEDLIDFYNPMEQKTTHFVYAKPEIKNGIAIYKSTDGESNISITIKKEKCNGAIDKQYDYSAQVQLNDKKYSGCAIKP